ncbi:hypothetical protein GTA08_BOTSDO09937 [Botryosphaeria dothidea]|uniref:Uncharacterized protein n=1 Tax=Botryosphaeria dothidea TaxID=55169 RepID=A0A8H4IKJ3_9PEZI|nr:hypothetical protein GTA08_BOTSDO09937 [Botryosphaeria dothidea]
MPAIAQNQKQFSDGTKSAIEKPPTTLDAELDNLYFSSKSDNFADKPTEDKLAEVREAFGHDMTASENPKVKKDAEKKAAPSKRELNAKKLKAKMEKKR